MHHETDHVKFSQIDAHEWEWSLPELKGASETHVPLLYGRVQALSRNEALLVALDDVSARLRVALTYLDDTQRRRAIRDNDWNDDSTDDDDVVESESESEEP